MSREPLQLLLVEDAREDAELIVIALRKAGFEPASERVDMPDALRAALARGGWDLVIADYRLGAFTGLDALAIVRETGADLPFILVSGAVGEDVAVSAMKAGAHDYVMKDKLVRLGPAVRRELVEAEGRRQRRIAEEGLRRAYQDLERRVAERTKELSDAGVRLRQELEERKRLEGERNRLFSQLLRGQKLQAIGQLAAGVAHEINNPVGWILTNLGAIEKYFKTLSELLENTTEVARGDEAREERVARIHQLREAVEAPFLLADFASALSDSKDGAVRIRDIVANLKSFAHPDRKEPEEADLIAILEGAIKLSAGEVKYKAEVVREFSPVPPLRCRPGELQQVFINLLVNAAQAIPERGRITVSVTQVGDEEVVRIRDTGAGIAPDHRKHLFEPFFTTKPVGKGTGLGLHVAYKIVRAHGGRIEVDSEPGRGTVMTVRLPLPRPASEGDGTPIVVLVDDDLPSLRGMKRALKGGPFRLMATRDPHQALDWVDHRGVDVVVTDQRMPEMLGTALLEEVARRSPGTRRLLVTAYPDSPEAETARGAAAEDVIAKPWAEEELRRAVESRLGAVSAKEGS
jgi:two-component system NtrC family sensor kinase